MVHPGGDALNTGAAGYKIWGGTTCQGHTKVEYTEWLQANADERQFNFVFNRKSEVLNPRMANAYPQKFPLQNGDP